jgi:hypothetical protein
VGKIACTCGFKVVNVASAILPTLQGEKPHRVGTAASLPLPTLRFLRAGSLSNP